MSDARKHQKKLEKKAAKRKAHARQLAQRQNMSFSQRLGAADRFPLVHCTVNKEALDKEGIGWVCVSRELPNGSIANALFLVDRYCLGVKDAIAQVISRFVYEDKVVRKLHRSGMMAAQTWDLAAARKLVEGAVAYAAQFGFKPHADYEEALTVFGSADSAACTETFEYGKDGKPFYISGPNDSLARIQQVSNALERQLGPGGYGSVAVLEERGGRVGDMTAAADEVDQDDDAAPALPPQ